jgi:ribosomal small subunit protein bTHX
MGKGDIRTKRGTIFRGTYGNSRPKKKNRKRTPEVANAKTGKGDGQ